MRTRLLAVIAVLAVCVAGAVSPASAKRNDMRIVGGTTATINDAPWQVALLNASEPVDFNAQFCGGSILNAEWVVTAAHCLVDAGDGSVLAASDLQVLAGKSNLGLDVGSSGPRTNVDLVKVHPDYDRFQIVNDVALLRLETPLTLDGTTRKAIALPTGVPNTWPAAATSALITGWGALSYGGSYPDQLRKATVDILQSPSSTVCGDYGATFVNTAEICAGVAGGGKDTCQGDSGGPLKVDFDGVPTLAGITSSGEQCALPNYPGLYTRVTSYVSWINATMTPTFIATPSSLNMGTTAVGQPITRSISIQNGGGKPLQISSATVGGEFSIDWGACASALDPGIACEARVTFSAATAGTATGNIVFQDNDPDSPHTVSVTATANAPVTPPAAPSRVLSKGTTKKTRVSWAASPGAASYDVKVTGKNPKGKKKTTSKTTSGTRLTVKMKLKKKSSAKACVRAHNSAGTSTWKCTKFKVI